MLNASARVVQTVEAIDNLVEDDDGRVLIQRHLNDNDGYFADAVRTTGVENENDPDANTYCVIGALDPNQYLQPGGYYDLKLIYKYSSGTEDVLEWTQTSWITDNYITGADLSKIDDSFRGTGDGREFLGLGYSLGYYQRAYLDGTGQDHDWYYHPIGATCCGIHAHEGRQAYSSLLWILPGIDSFLNDFVTRCNLMLASQVNM